MAILFSSRNTILKLGGKYLKNLRRTKKTPCRPLHYVRKRMNRDKIKKRTTCGQLGSLRGQLRNIAETVGVASMSTSMVDSKVLHRQTSFCREKIDALLSKHVCHSFSFGYSVPSVKNGAIYHGYKNCL